MSLHCNPVPSSRVGFCARSPSIREIYVAKTTSQRAEGTVKTSEAIERMEPTSRLEPLTCRLRIDPVLRMLLCDRDYSRAFWSVFEHSGNHWYSTWLQQHDQPISDRQAWSFPEL